MARRPVRPADGQPPLPLERFILEEQPGEERIDLDVLFVGGGPAGLAGAIELSRLARRERAEISIGVLEKASALGEHCLSGAIVDPSPFRELFPDVPDADLPFAGPVPGERVYWLGEKGQWRIPTPPGNSFSRMQARSSRSRPSSLPRVWASPSRSG